METLEMDLEYHSKTYELHTSIWQYLDNMLKVMSEQEILASEDLYPLVDHTVVSCNGRVCEQAVRFLQKKVRMQGKKTGVYISLRGCYTKQCAYLMYSIGGGSVDRAFD